MKKFIALLVVSVMVLSSVGAFALTMPPGFYNWEQYVYDWEQESLPNVNETAHAINSPVFVNGVEFELDFENHSRF